METSSENIDTEKTEPLSFHDNEEKGGGSQYTMNGIVLFLTEKLGRAVGVLTRQSGRVLTKAGRGIAVGAKEFGKRVEENKTKASKSATEEISAGIADEPVHTEDVKDDAKASQATAANASDEGKGGQESADSKQEVAEDIQAKTTSKGQPRRKEKVKVDSDATEEPPSADEKEKAGLDAIEEPPSADEKE